MVVIRVIYVEIALREKQKVYVLEVLAMMLAPVLVALLVAYMAYTGSLPSATMAVILVGTAALEIVLYISRPTGLANYVWPSCDNCLRAFVVVKQR